MTVLPERFVRFAIRDYKENIRHLEGFVSLGNELARYAEYKEWLSGLEKYYEENYSVTKQA